MRYAAAGLVVCSTLLLIPAAATGQPSNGATGQADFDWQIGTWRTELSLLVNPLTDSARWISFEGTTVVRQVWDGGANLVELEVGGPTGRLEGLSLRLYDPRTRQWTMHYANRRTGVLTDPVVGGFVDGRGRFLGRATLADGRPVYVRFEMTELSSGVWRFEQAFSTDGGAWETNWIAVDTRVAEGVP